MHCNGELLGPGSGFYYRKGSRLFLVSNWHVFCGRHPKTRQPIHSSCAVPDEQTFYLQSLSPEGKLEAVGYTDRLRNSCGAAEWWEHPTLGSNIDVGVVELLGELKEKQTRSAELIGGEKLPVKIGQDVFVLGYPKGLMKQGLLPVWKRGSIASEPELDVEGSPVILIDSGTREGMSGSPVVAMSRASGFGRDDQGNIIVGDRARLLGIYSGRYGAEQFQEVQLGICWKVSLIDEIIDGEKPANLELSSKA
jgi:Trypsin-like peptidase domain